MIKCIEPLNTRKLDFCVFSVFGSEISSTKMYVKPGNFDVKLSANKVICGLLIRGESRKEYNMKKAESNNSDKLSVWDELDIKFFRYKELRDDTSREALQVTAYEAYSYDYLQRRLSSWPTTWVDVVRTRLCEKIDDAIDNPEVVATSFKGYLYGWFRSIRSSVNEKRSREVIGLLSAPDGGDMTTDEEGSLSETTTVINETRDSDRRTAATNAEGKEMSAFMCMLWTEAWNTKGLPGRIFRLYMMGLLARQHGAIKEEFKYKGIANQLGLNPQTVASYIRRTKLALRKSFQERAHAWGIID